VDDFTQALVEFGAVCGCHVTYIACDVGLTLHLVARAAGVNVNRALSLPVCRPNASATLLVMDTAARRIWLVSAYFSDSGKAAVNL